jgi:hypothetical protein
VCYPPPGHHLIWSQPDSTEEVVILFEVELQKTRNLSTHESEECEHGEGVCVYATLLQSDTL